MDTASTEARPGVVALLGSGETAAIGRRVLLDLLRSAPPPRTVAVLDTPAGFQPNADQVVGKLVEFIATRLAEAQPIPRALRVRRAVTEADQRTLIQEIRAARCIVAGPGIPSYTVRQLLDTPFAAAIHTAHRQGSSLYVASAAAIAMGAFCLPVYEIFKAGMDLAWMRGLDLLGDLGLKLAIVPHWNNSEGGAQLDTCYCYMGEERFQALCRLLPDDVTFLGIDEHTACVIDFAANHITCRGKGATHILRADHVRDLTDGQSLPLDALSSGGARQEGEPPKPVQGCNIWGAAASEISGSAERETKDTTPADAANEYAIPRQLVAALLAIRADLREGQLWTYADRLRDALRSVGVAVEDGPTPAKGYRVPVTLPVPHARDERGRA